MDTLTPLESRLLASLKAAVSAHERATCGVARVDWLAEARALIAELEPEPIPVGEARDSDFGEFEEAAS